MQGQNSFHSERVSRVQRRIVALNAVAACLVVAAIAIVPTGSRVVVMVPPWSAPDRIVAVIAAAGGTLIDGGRTPWMAVAEGTSPGFVNRLFSSGALLILDGRLAGACVGGKSA